MYVFLRCCVCSFCSFSPSLPFCPSLSLSICHQPFIHFIYMYTYKHINIYTHLLWCAHVCCVFVVPIRYYFNACSILIFSNVKKICFSSQINRPMLYAFWSRENVCKLPVCVRCVWINENQHNTMNLGKLVVCCCCCCCFNVLLLSLLSFCVCVFLVSGGKVPPNFTENLNEKYPHLHRSQHHR